jgi:hypothetical protein
LRASAFACAFFHKRVLFGAVAQPDGSRRPEPGPLRYAGLGLQLAVTLVLGVLAGQWLDRKAGTDGVFAIVGALVGFAATLYSLIRQLGRSNDRGP